jgi:hypothetical protein
VNRDLELAGGGEGYDSLLVEVKRILSEGKERARKAVETKRVRAYC